MNNKADIVPGETKRTLQPLLWGLVAVALAIAIIGLAWYVYPRLQHQETAIGDLRNAQIATEKEIKALPAPISPQVVEAARERVRDRFEKFQKKVAADIANVHKQAVVASEDAYQRAKALVDLKMQAVEVRLAGLESSHAAGEIRVAELTKEVGKLQEQLNVQANELLAVRHELATRKNVEEREIAGLRHFGERNHKDVEALEAGLATHRVEFEVTKHHETEVAPGIYVQIDKANTSFSYVNGWMRLMPEDHAFWFHRQDTNAPFIFYSAKDAKPYELVLTAMRGTSIKGYVVLPGPNPAPGTPPVAGE